MATRSIGTRKKIEEQVIDAKGQVLGRVASQVAVILQGKHRADYQQNQVGSARVIVKNAGKIKVTGRKLTDKVYYRHTGYMGHLKSKNLKEVMEQDPARALRQAVFNMLPKNFLRQRRMNRLTIEA